MSSEKCFECPQNFFAPARERRIEACQKRIEVIEEKLSVHGMKRFMNYITGRTGDLIRSRDLTIETIDNAWGQAPSLEDIKSCDGPYERTVGTDSAIYRQQICGAYEQNNVSTKLMLTLQNNPATEN